MLVNEGAAPPGTPAALSNEPLLQPGTVRGLSKRYRVGMYDEVQGVACDWSLGLSVGSTLTGAHSSPDTFGHGGSQSSMGFADPEHRLAVVVVTNARPGPKAHYERMYRLATVLYEDLGLAQRLSPLWSACLLLRCRRSTPPSASMPTANQVTVESGYCRIRLCRELVVAAPTAVDRGGTSFEDCEPSRIDLLPKKHQYRLRVVDHVTLVYLARRRRVVEQSDVATLLRLPARVVQRRNPENSFAIPQIDGA